MKASDLKRALRKFGIHSWASMTGWYFHGDPTVVVAAKDVRLAQYVLDAEFPGVHINVHMDADDMDDPPPRNKFIDFGRRESITAQIKVNAGLLPDTPDGIAADYIDENLIDGVHGIAAVKFLRGELTP